MVNLPTPAIKALQKLGKDINEARRRQRITIEFMAERASLSRGTVGKIEKGDPSTSIGGYASVLFILGMTDRLSELAHVPRDSIDGKLEDEKLPKRVRIAKEKR